MRKYRRLPRSLHGKLEGARRERTPMEFQKKPVNWWIAAALFVAWLAVIAGWLWSTYGNGA
jgi:hypothetical protein